MGINRNAAGSERTDEEANDPLVYPATSTTLHALCLHPFGRFFGVGFGLEPIARTRAEHGTEDEFRRLRQGHLETRSLLIARTDT